jgi:hypothetical protein
MSRDREAELSKVILEAMDLCVRARKLDDAIPRPGDDPFMPRSATPALWVLEQYDNDLAAWEAKARAVLARAA